MNSDINLVRHCMNIETAQTKLNKNDILAAFGDRVLMGKREKQKREFLDLDPDLPYQTFVPTDVTNKYEAIEIKDCFATDSKLLQSPSHKPLFVKLLKAGSDPVSLVVYKTMWKTKETSKPESEFIIQIVKGDLTEKGDREVIDLGQNLKNEIGSIRLSQSAGNTFEMMHRFVREDYRGPQSSNGLRISNILLNISEQIVQNYATSKGKESTLKINSGQLDVMAWLYNNNYKLRGSHDEERFNKICNADENLRIIDDFYVYESHKIPKKDEIYQKRHDAFRVAFVRQFAPESKPILNPGLEKEEAKQRADDEQEITDIRKKLSN